MTRTLVSFEAPERAFPVDRDESDNPAGKEIAELVSATLRNNDVEHDGPNERGGWAWQLSTSNEQVSVECIVGLVDDAPRQWLIATHVRPRARLRKRFRDENEAAAELLCDAWVRSIQEVCNGPHGWTSLRWYDEADFNRDHGDTWSPTPFD